MRHHLIALFLASLLHGNVCAAPSKSIEESDSQENIFVNRNLTITVTESPANSTVTSDVEATERPENATEAPNLEEKRTLESAGVAPNLEEKRTLESAGVAPNLEEKRTLESADVAPNLEEKRTLESAGVAPNLEEKRTLESADVAPNLEEKRTLENAGVAPSLAIAVSEKPSSQPQPSLPIPKASLDVIKMRFFKKHDSQKIVAIQRVIYKPGEGYLEVERKLATYRVLKGQCEKIFNTKHRYEDGTWGYRIANIDFQRELELAFDIEGEEDESKTDFSDLTARSAFWHRTEHITTEPFQENSKNWSSIRRYTSRFFDAGLKPRTLKYETHSVIN